MRFNCRRIAQWPDNEASDFISIGVHEEVEVQINAWTGDLRLVPVAKTSAAILYPGHELAICSPETSAERQKHGAIYLAVRICSFKGDFFFLGWTRRLTG